MHKLDSNVSECDFYPQQIAKYHIKRFHSRLILVKYRCEVIVANLQYIITIFYNKVEVREGEIVKDKRDTMRIVVVVSCMTLIAGCAYLAYNLH